MAPPGIKLIVQLKPQKRGSWDQHGIQGYYTDPTLHHYRCYRTFIPKTMLEYIITDTVSFFSSTILVPACSTDDYLQQSLDDILYLLKYPSATVPSLLAGDEKENAIRIVAEILKINNNQQSSFTETISPHLQEKITDAHQYGHTQHRVSNLRGWHKNCKCYHSEHFPERHINKDYITRLSKYSTINTKHSPKLNSNYQTFVQHEKCKIF